MKFIKEHKYLVILAVVFVLLIILGLGVKDSLIADGSKGAYGTRLNNKDEHKIEKSLYTKIKSEYETKNNVDKLTYREQGKIINFIITVSKDVSVSDARSLGDNIISYFEKEDLSYYTIQIYIKKEDATLNNFPIIGAKDPKTEKVSWTLDREISKESDSNED